MVSIANTKTGLSRRAILTCAGVSLLGRLLFSLGDDEGDRED